jgi:hypothetical protein
MSKLRAVLDRINDIEATISRIELESKGDIPLSTQLSLQSLEGRRDMLREELALVTRSEHVEICDYKIIPENANSYALSAVTTALHDFQDMVTLVFDAITSKPKQRASVSPDVQQKTQFDFGFAYSGSLGVVLTIQNDRLLLDENSKLDSAVSAVFKLVKIRSPEAVREAAHTYGAPTIKKLYHWSKTHSQYGMSADIKWIRDAQVRDEVIAQSPEMEALSHAIAEKSEKETEPVRLNGELLGWNVHNRSFVMAFPETRPISGRWADDFEGAIPRKVPGYYSAELTKETTVRFSEEKDLISWVLNRLNELPSVK